MEINSYFLTSQFPQIICILPLQQIHLMMPSNANYSPMNSWLNSAPKYEVMRRIVESVPEPSRNILLGNALSSAINSINPLDTMDKKLIDLPKAKTSVMMLNDLATSCGMNKASIMEFLKLKFKQN